MSEPETLEQTCNRLRAEALTIEQAVRNIVKSDALAEPETFPGQRGEQKAQCMLAVRHLEDARMRLGKIIQYARDGVSIFDAPKAP